MLHFLVPFPIFLTVGFCALLIPFLHPAVTGFTRGLVEISAMVIRLSEAARPRSTWESVFVLLTLTIFWTWVRRMAAP